ncbi:glycerophosphodiester phosphodiesterase family protein [Kocuria sp.]|uniref:glycerophosphodiester phosphodiesterase n=1 Tax=Kocuria sp. TaxID=1871328 RepID=UPI0026DD40AC|nr:glycerophosphodiester phosphodiesterase family protein [Kocuria sp.]MDO4918173.1 glycerophosphodiester phosphodiesterase family protein [Kocuria sp.]
MADLTESSPARPLVYAHRGSSRRYPELTRAAFVQALADGADGVECDVHLTRDGHLVLHHDAHLGRTSDGSGPVARHTLAQLRRLDVTSWKGVRIPASHGAAHEQLMTLDELLDLLLAAGRPVGLAVETKHPSPCGQALEEAVLALLMRRGWNPETGWLGTVLVSLMSFHPDAVRHLLDYVPPRHVCQLLSHGPVALGERPSRVGAATAALCRAGMRFVVPPAVPLISRGEVGIAGPGIQWVRENPWQVEQWLRNGSVLRVWTVDTRADVQLCLALGVQQITTNVPALVRAWTDPQYGSGPAPGALPRTSQPELVNAYRP